MKEKRTEKELIQGILNTGEFYDGLLITEEELEIIEQSTEVESCEYVGLENGHEGLYTYHVTLAEEPNKVKSLYVE